MNYRNASYLIGIAVLIVFISITAGCYPSMFLSSVKTVNSLKNILRNGERGTILRKVLVVVQFSLAIILIAGTTTVYLQLKYIKDKKLGFNKENIIYFKAKGKFQHGFAAVKNDLLAHSSILNVSAEDRLLINNASSTNNLFWKGKDSNTDVHVEYSYVDYNYFDMLGIKFKEGRNFSRDMGSDNTAFILNEEAVNQMKLNNPVGSGLVMNGLTGKIIGVIYNANLRSLHNKVEPCVFLTLKDYSNLSFVYNGIILIKVAPGKSQEAITAIENIWKKENSEYPFEYHFLDETIDKQYRKEIQTGKLFGYFSLIAIIISSLGLYGLSLFIMENKIKEIGIRKVLGASILSLINMFYNEFSKLILISSLIACPVAWYVMKKWLLDFAYRIEISWWMFAFAGGIALVIALLTVSFQAIKAATANPVESLRYE